ncbi:MAG TPA: efflux RND transporter periplasmic adaptor subunit [Gammaproteobacteria bacterium]|jgi:HlyD family secretion protein
MAERLQTGDIQSTLNIHSHGGRFGKWRWPALGAAFILVALYFIAPFGGDSDTRVSYTTALVSRGELTLTVTATGNLQPLNQVIVGSELSGTLATVEVDFNDEVKVDQVLARLDTTALNSRIAEGKASLQQAQAAVAESQATELEKRAALDRCKELAKKQLCSGNDLDIAEAAYARARAAVSSARAQVAMAQAILDGYETNLKKATIRSPINGIVLNRAVERGQTVAASLQTPELFTLAEDLTRMELIVAVDEADIGQVRDGQQAVFSVDAYQDKSFRGEISQIRHAPQTVEGVVSYETVLAVENPELLLLPGMTATAEITTRHIEDALLIPNAALRYAPPAATEEQNGNSGPLLSRLFRRPSRRDDGPAVTEGRERTVWVLRQGKPEAVEITIGASDGRMTAVIGGPLEPEMALITASVTGKN